MMRQYELVDRVLKYDPGADEALPQPERQPLLANPCGALEQKRRRERIPPDRIIEPASDGVVAVQWE